MEGDKYFNLATGEQPFNLIEYDFGVVHVPQIQCLYIRFDFRLDEDQKNIKCNDSERD